LLIFFIVAIKHEDILSRLEVLRPAASKDPVAREPISIVIGPSGYTFRGRPMGEAELGRSLARIAHYDTSTMITLRCLPESDHGLLVKALDLCSRSELNQLAVFSQ
jgi:biopolymer transport protein ExbD